MYILISALISEGWWKQHVYTDILYMYIHHAMVHCTIIICYTTTLFTPLLSHQLLYMYYLRSVSVIDSECSQANDQLRRLAVVLPDVASLSPLDYDTSKRADPEVLQKIVQHAKSLRVSLSIIIG